MIHDAVFPHLLANHSDDVVDRFGAVGAMVSRCWYQRI